MTPQEDGGQASRRGECRSGQLLNPRYGGQAACRYRNRSPKQQPPDSSDPPEPHPDLVDALRGLVDVDAVRRQRRAVDGHERHSPRDVLWVLHHHAELACAEADPCFEAVPPGWDAGVDAQRRRRRHQQQGLYVLELIAEADGAAGLVEASPSFRPVASVLTPLKSTPQWFVFSELRPL